MAGPTISLFLQLGRDPAENSRLIKRLEGLTNPADIGKVVERTVGQRVWAMTLEAFYGNLLSTPATWLVNIVGNTYKMAQALVERPLAAGINALSGGRLGNTTIAEVRGQWFGFMTGHRDAFYRNRAFLGKAIRTNPLRKSAREELKPPISHLDRRVSGGDVA